MYWMHERLLPRILTALRNDSCSLAYSSMPGKLEDQADAFALAASVISVELALGLMPRMVNGSIA